MAKRAKGKKEKEIKKNSHSIAFIETPNRPGLVVCRKLRASPMTKTASPPTTRSSTSVNHRLMKGSNPVSVTDQVAGDFRFWRPLPSRKRGL